MGNHKHSTKRIFIAWMLLALFMLPMAVKSVHVCQVDGQLSTATHSTGHHSQGHNADDCAICNFAFFSFLKAATVHLDAVAVLFIGFLFIASVTTYVRPEVEVTSLRAPPARL
ncbi:MAG: hypothetical protein K6A82_03850 [Prevotella sp.]|nr:hypothetical protein [Prevotella sp.]